MSTLTSSQRTALLATLGLTSIAALVAWKQRSQRAHSSTSTSTSTSQSQSQSQSPAVPITEEPVDIANKEISNAQRQREKEIKEGKRPPTKPHAERPRLTGTTKISVPHLYAADDREKLGIIHPTWEIELSNDDLQFELNPGYLGEGPSRFLYLNAQDVEWYKQQLPAPTLIVWVMCKRGLFLDVAYAKRRLMEEAFKLNIQIVNINPRKLDIYYPASPTDDSQWLMYEKKLCARPHAVLTRAGANIDYFGRCAIRHLESLGIKVFNDMASLDISRDKLYTHQILCPYGVPVPKSILTQLPVEISYVEKHFTYPIILKSTYGSLGEQVWKADNREELEKLLPTMDYDKPLIFQEFVANSSGRDLRIFVVGDHVAAAMMRMAPTGFKANIAQGGTAKRVNIEPQLEHMAVQVTKRCKLDMAGIDVLMDKGTYKICEVNASPLFEGLERATGVNVAYAIMSYIKEWCHERGIGNR